MERSGAQVVGEPRLGLEHEHRDVLPRERERDEQPDRPCAGDDDAIDRPDHRAQYSQMTSSSACRPRRVSAIARASAPGSASARSTRSP